ncbi:voltage-dependent calcium channel subunit alpha-2/delta-3-like isoform X3 [Zootermopsis nevadensis]|uniref:voltage-dependent calcium channel subunit alpha-2/delta-3-like isoform X3 n=1 Tax=Zootermopsis nevadensis TaxID=136037 RepID=UPI000B8E3B5D|nr:voltage-dependent calcium channel subunit alpha-2/delta-3-like isoform X3 [Zootermopsis nevadensis]
MTGRLLLVCIVAALSAAGTAWCKISVRAVESWAQTLSSKLWDLSQICATNDLDGRQPVRSKSDSFKYFYAKEFKVDIKNDSLLAEDIAASIHDMTQLKLSAVRRIVNNAETLALRLYQDKQATENYTYYGTKAYDPSGKPLDFVKRLDCTPNKHFHGEAVNTSFSSVHIPTYIYHRAPKVLEAVEWTEDLDAVFKSNYELDPSLSWQYFCSGSGIMRQYPGVFMGDSEVDMFDCRMRLWYIDASLSPKDVIVLVDNSGSMTGISQKIARHLVNSILETLGSNDFVNVLTFNNSTDRLIKCARNVSLIQATLGNLRELKVAMKDLKGKGIANFSLALTEAFKLYNTSLQNNLGAHCNRAIMVITDGMPDIYEDIFDKYNWEADMRVRVFTYLIGKEQPEAHEMKSIACNNNGHFALLMTTSEAREKVIEYMPIMSQPLVLLGERPVSWTPVYADLADPNLTDLWVHRENKEQSDLLNFCYIPYQTDKETPKDVFKNCSENPELRRAEDATWISQVYQYVVSVSMPVLDVGKNKVGVNGFVFMITNNGHVVIHPNWRPEFMGILKPNYNSVDLTEVEHVDDDSIVLGSSHPDIIKLRRAMIDQEYGKKNLQLKYHFDHMRRVSTVKRQYTHIGVKDTPYAIGIALPFPYGMHIARPLEDKLKILTTRRPARTFKDLIKQIWDFSQDRNWTVHPNWVYCKYHYDTVHDFSSSEEELQHFLEELMDAGKGFRCSPVFHLIPPEQMNSAPYPKLKMDSCYCDMDLFSSLIHDATETRFWSSTVKHDRIIRAYGEHLKEFGVSLMFLATQSGLTRWQLFKGNVESRNFKDSHTQTIDEVWYQQAVDLQDETGIFVYSVPFSKSLGYNSDALVTASYAVFTEDRKVPLAVVGYQFQHLKLFNEFVSITSKATGCAECTCSSNELTCYIIDNNGFVVASEAIGETGKFFGEVEGNVMNALVNEKVFRKVHIIDYQAICIHASEDTNRASFLTTPMQHLMKIFHWLIGTVVWLYAESCFWHKSWTNAAKETTTLSLGDAKINRTRLEPCIKEVDLYQLQSISYSNSKVISSSCCSEYVVVQKLFHSNLILVVVDTLCSDDIWTEVRITEMEVKDSNLFCLKVVNNELTQKQPKTCVGKGAKREMLQESRSAECGCNLQFQANFFLSLISLCLGVLRTTNF